MAQLRKCLFHSSLPYHRTFKCKELKLHKNKPPQPTTVLLPQSTPARNIAMDRDMHNHKLPKKKPPLKRKSMTNGFKSSKKTWRGQPLRSRTRKSGSVTSTTRRRKKRRQSVTHRHKIGLKPGGTPRNVRPGKEVKGCEIKQKSQTLRKCGMRQGGTQSQPGSRGEVHWSGSKKGSNPLRRDLCHLRKSEQNLQHSCPHTSIPETTRVTSYLPPDLRHRVRRLHLHPTPGRLHTIQLKGGTLPLTRNMEEDLTMVTLTVNHLQRNRGTKPLHRHDVTINSDKQPTPT